MLFPGKPDNFSDGSPIFIIDEMGGSESLRDPQLLNRKVSMWIHKVEKSKIDVKGIGHSYVLSFKDPLEGKTLSLYFLHH